MKKTVLWLAGAAVLAATFAVGRHTASWWTTPHAASEHGTAPGEQARQPALWTCPMHPEIRLPDRVPCPKCGMDLVPWQRDELGPRRLAMTAASVRLAGIETAPVQRRFVTLPVRMVGKVDYDETRVRTIAARVPGRLDRLFVDFTGIQVATGDHLVSLYSPQLLAAQQELIEVRHRLDATAAEPSQFLADSNRRGYQAAREKLLLWGLTVDQVDAIEARGTAEDHMMIRSPASGVVIDKRLDEGAYVSEGTAIYRIADLGRLWIQLDAYEQDLPWLRYGQAVQIVAEAVPGHLFEGWISFLDPMVDARRRTVRIRVDVDNRDGRLKPGMFVRAVVRSRIGGDGQVLEPRLAGKWISPMHPEVVKDGPGQCDVCGMDLVPAESLGYVNDVTAARPLIVPASAVLVTGTRAVTYVAVTGGEKPVYEGREIVLGPRAGDDYIVRSGLEENEQVVVQGAFRIDSAMQIRAKPSMMTMPGEGQLFIGNETVAFRASLGPVYAAYFALQAGLAADDAAAAKAAATTLQDSLGGLDPEWLSRRARQLLDEEQPELASAAAAVAASADIGAQRLAFATISRGILAIERAFRHDGAAPRFELFCPMALGDTGAAWLHTDREIRNPYFGASMLTCGEVRSELPGVPASGSDDRPLDPAVAAAIEPLYAAYFEWQLALAADDLANARMRKATVATAAASSRQDVDAEIGAILELVIDDLGADLDGLASHRQHFATVSSRLARLHARTGHLGTAPFFRIHCPMAFDNKGADWLQRDDEVLNPYFGTAMQNCGKVASRLLPSGAER
ncbi:MAG: efflux RND transporter periplasmic adaptor subunit [Planctomycetes bacterium]|nr:efflux RND transporter periplasmic adaptor subunit [Planctomycetota bacterium]